MLWNSSSFFSVSGLALVFDFIVKLLINMLPEFHTGEYSWLLSACLAASELETGPVWEIKTNSRWAGAENITCLSSVPALLEKIVDLEIFAS